MQTVFVEIIVFEFNGKTADKLIDKRSACSVGAEEVLQHIAQRLIELIGHGFGVGCVHRKFKFHVDGYDKRRHPVGERRVRRRTVSAARKSEVGALLYGYGIEQNKIDIERFDFFSRAVQYSEMSGYVFPVFKMGDCFGNVHRPVGDHVSVFVTQHQVAFVIVIYGEYIGRLVPFFIRYGLFVKGSAFGVA